MVIFIWSSRSHWNPSMDPLGVQAHQVKIPWSTVMYGAAFPPCDSNRVKSIWIMNPQDSLLETIINVHVSCQKRFAPSESFKSESQRVKSNQFTWCGWSQFSSVQTEYHNAGRVPHLTWCMNDNLYIILA